eukprot:5254032-Amphidinium_carterae.2
MGHGSLESTCARSLMRCSRMVSNTHQWTHAHGSPYQFTTGTANKYAKCMRRSEVRGSDDEDEPVISPTLLKLKVYFAAESQDALSSPPMSATKQDALRHFHG